MKQRVAIARALVENPDFIMMDEPFAALDFQTRVLMQQFLLEVWLEFKPTIIFVTHHIDEAVLLADRVVVMSAGPGRIIEEVRIDLPRPRRMTDPGFNDYRARLTETLRARGDARLRDDEAARGGLPMRALTRQRRCALGFADLFDHARHRRRCATARRAREPVRPRRGDRRLSVARARSAPRRCSLVDQPGVCPDCSPVPAAVIALPDAPSFPREGEERPVRVVGRLDYGFRIDDGTASMLRIEGRSGRPHRGPSVKQLIHGGRLLTAGRLDGALRRSPDRRRHHRRRAGAGRERRPTTPGASTPPTGC